MLALLEEMQRRGEVLKLNLVVCASSEEETGCGGAPVFARWVRRRGLKLDQLLVAEPTTCAPIYGHKGSSNVIFEIHGEAVHSSKPHGSRVYASARCALKLAIWVRSRSNSSSPTSRFFRMGAGRWTRIWARPLRDGTRGSAARRVCSHEKAAHDGQRSDCERLRTLNAERTVCEEVGCFERLAIPIAFDTQTIRPALFWPDCATARSAAAASLTTSTFVGVCVTRPSLTFGRPPVRLKTAELFEPRGRRRFKLQATSRSFLRK
jgi:hypothetical protein